MIKAVINVRSPRSQVFSVLTNYARYGEWVPGCERCVVTAQSGNTTDTQITINSMRRIDLSLRFEAQPEQALTFRMTRGSDIRSYNGMYRLMDSADGAGTVVIAELEIDAGLMVPRFMVDRVARRMIEETGASLRSHLKKIGMLPAAKPAIAAPASAHRRRRNQRLLRVTKSTDGITIWWMGQTHHLKYPEE